MPMKLSFQVLHVSGCDNGYAGKELQTHSPTTKGWQSSRFCVYPQEIIICLKEPSLISKIQILSHQYNIASKIEMFLSLPSTPGSQSLVGLKFKRLGYIHMSNNEGSNFQARELKSVPVNSEGQLIKFLFHKNHVNKLNLYNQVCIVAINVLGQSLSQKYNDDITNTNDLINYYMKQINENESHANLAPLNFARYDDGKILSPLDDLSFDMYQDPETAQLIRKLEEKKTQAIIEERYDFAKKLKQAMFDLHKVGEKLGQYEVEKRRAVEAENFDLAKKKKIQSEEYRLFVYKQLDIYDLLEIKQENKLPIPQNTNVFESKVKKTATPQQRTYSPEDVKLPPVVTPSKGTSQLVVSNQSPMLSRKSPQLSTPANTTNSFAEHNDERPLPALKGKLSMPALEAEDEATVGDHDAELPILTEKEEREASFIIEVFGMNLAKQLYSKSWKHRQESLTSIHTELTNPSEISTEHSPKEISQASVQVLKKILNDQVFVVLQQSVNLLKTLLLSYLPQSTLGKSEVNHILEKLLPLLMKRTGDVATRSRNLMVDTMVEIGSAPSIKNLGIVPNLLTEPIKSKKQTPWRLLKSQIELTHTLIKDLGINTDGGFSTDRLMKILTVAFEHQNNDVRDASLKCIIEAYKIVKAPIKSYFPPDDAISRKNPLYLRLYDAFDRADGKPTEAERKAAAKKQKEEAEKNKAEEVKALQEQLQNLRSMANAQIDAKSEENNNVAEKPKDLKNKSNAKVTTKKEKEVVKRESKLKPLSRKGSSKPASDKMCIFCGEKNDSFTEEGLDVHYWKSCPMLKRCDSCSQVVEISSMNDHLVTECEKKEEYVKCKVCQNVIKQMEEKEHLSSQLCTDASAASKSAVCALCKKLVKENEENWKHHLQHECPVNSQRLQESQGGTKTKKATSKSNVTGTGTGRGTARGANHAARGRGRGSMSKLPTRTPKKK